MATVKVKLRPSSVAGRAGTVYYRVTHNRTTRHITTDIHLCIANAVSLADMLSDTAATASRSSIDPVSMPRSGSAATTVLPSDNPAQSVSCTMARYRIESDVALLRRIIREFDHSCRRYTAADVVGCFRSHGGRTGILDYLRVQISQLRRANRLGTAQSYEKTMRSFSMFLGGCDLPLPAITERLIADYNAFLVRRGMVRNSVSFYMRVLRAVYNKAVRQRLVEQSHPFQDVYTGIDRTRKRAVDESVIAALHRMRLPERSALALARDMFVFSYCTRGMAFVDMAYLTHCNVQNGMICYARRKTGQLLSIRIEPSIRRIIDRYALPDSHYVFPVLTSVDADESYAQYQAAINTYNRMLRRLSDMLPAECRLTSYTSRHSWATAARNHNVPLSVISAGMGHSTEQTTRIYLAMLENSVIDDANSTIIGCLDQ